MTELLNHLFEHETLFHAGSRMRSDPEIPEISAKVSVLILVPEPVMPEPQREQLNKIIQACKLTISQCLITGTDYSWLDFRLNKAIRAVILFGVQEHDFGLNILLPLHQPVDFDDRKWIKTLSVPALMDNAGRKAELWQQALKPVFAP